MRANDSSPWQLIAAGSMTEYFLLVVVVAAILLSAGLFLGSSVEFLVDRVGHHLASTASALPKQ